MAHDVFISYPSLNKAIADAICAKLEENKIRCWIAPRDVLPGQKYTEALLNAIDSSQVFILVFSENTNNSPHIISEVQRAFTKNKIIIPFRIEDIQPSTELQYFIGTAHWLDALTPSIEQQISRLVEVVQHTLAMPPRSGSGSSGNVSSNEPVRSQKGSSLKNKYVAISGIILIIFIILVFSLGQHPDTSGNVQNLQGAQPTTTIIQGPQVTQPATTFTESLQPTQTTMNTNTDSEGATPVYFAGTGNYYSAVSVPGGITWTDAKSAAEQRTFRSIHGHLVTITSKEENDFILSSFRAVFSGFWIGGFQKEGSKEPDGGWEWVTGEPFSFTYWDVGPNNHYGGDQGVHGYGYPEDAIQLLWWDSSGKWNDIPHDIPFPGYIVEYETKSHSNT